MPLGRRQGEDNNIYMHKWHAGDSIITCTTTAHCDPFHTCTFSYACSLNISVCLWVVKTLMNVQVQLEWKWKQQYTRLKLNCLTWLALHKDNCTFDEIVILFWHDLNEYSLKFGGILFFRKAMHVFFCIKRPMCGWRQPTGSTKQPDLTMLTVQCGLGGGRINGSENESRQNKQMKWGF